jgi:hypothetical protein
MGSVSAAGLAEKNTGKLRSRSHLALQAQQAFEIIITSRSEPKDLNKMIERLL